MGKHGGSGLCVPLQGWVQDSWRDNCRQVTQEGGPGVLTASRGDDGRACRRDRSRTRWFARCCRRWRSHCRRRLRPARCWRAAQRRDLGHRRPSRCFVGVAELVGRAHVEQALHPRRRRANAKSLCVQFAQAGSRQVQSSAVLNEAIGRGLTDRTDRISQGPSHAGPQMNSPDLSM